MKIKYFLITAVLATVILCSGGIVKAQTATNCMSYSNVSDQITCLTNLIAQLTQQIAQLQAQQGQTQTWCHTFNANIGVGVKKGNPEIDALVTALQKQGLIDQGATFNNGYDENLASAVTGLQEKYASEILTPSNLKHGTGYLGKYTREKLNALYGCAKKPTCTPNWTCGWGPCVNGYQSQVAVDSNNCGLSSSNVNIACTALARECTPSTSIAINSVSGPTSLNIGQTGTWTINATVPVGTTPTYSVNWGDIAAMANSTFGGTSVSQTSAFTHAFSQAGTYTVSFKVEIPAQTCSGVYTTCPNTSQSAETTITVVVGNSTQPSIKIIAPNGGETLIQNTTAIINWTSQNVSSVDIYLAPTGNCSYPSTCMTSPQLIAASVAGYVYSWKVNAPLGNQKIMITQAGNFSVSDSSDNFFTVVAPTITVIAPNGGEVWQNGTLQQIKWDISSGYQTSNVSIKLSQYRAPCPATGACNLGAIPAMYIILDSINASLQSYSWKVGEVKEFYSGSSQSVVPAGQYTVSICIIGTNYCDTNDNPLTITSNSTQPSITSISPSSSPIGAWITINGYNLRNVSTLVWLTSATDKGLIADAMPSSDNTFTAHLASSQLCRQNMGESGLACTSFMTVTPGSYSIYVENAGGTSNSVPFSIVAPTTTPSITVLSPNGGEQWNMGQTYNITWTSNGVQTVNLSLNFGASAFYTIASNIPASSGSYSWTIPDNVPLRLPTWLVINSGSVADYSNNSFSIVAIANLTSAQMSAVVNLLTSFGASASTIANVQITLNGGTPQYSLNSLTSSQIQAVISLLQSFGANATVITNVQTVLSGVG